MPSGSASFGSQSFTDVQSVTTPLISVIASADTIAPTSKITRLTGNTTVKTITVPTGYFNGPIYVYNTDASVGTWDTTGNIALAGTFTRFHAFHFLFDPSTSKWYPNAVS